MDNIINNTYLNNSQIKKLVKLNKENEDIMLDNQVKIQEKSRIEKILKELDKTKTSLENSVEKNIIDSLNLNKYNNDNKLSLNMLKESKIVIDSDSAFHNTFINDLLKADNIDFSLFYYGNKDDILNIINDSFINFEINNPIQLLYDKNMSKEEKIDFINLAIQSKLLLTKSINKSDIEMFYKSIGLKGITPTGNINKGIYSSDKYKFLDALIPQSVFLKNNNQNKILSNLLF